MGRDSNKQLSQIYSKSQGNKCHRKKIKQGRVLQSASGRKWGYSATHREGLSEGDKGGKLNEGTAGGIGNSRTA